MEGKEKVAHTRKTSNSYRSAPLDYCLRGYIEVSGVHYPLRDYDLKTYNMAEWLNSRHPL